MEVIDKLKKAITPKTKEEKLKAAQKSATESLFSEEKLNKRIEWAEQSMKVAEDTLELLKSFDYENEDESCIVDLGDIVHNLAIMSPHRMKALFPVLVQEYTDVLVELRNIKEGTEVFRRSRHGK